MPPRVQLNLRIDEDEKAALLAESEERGLDLSDIVREKIRDGKRFAALRDLLPRSQYQTILNLLKSQGQ